MRGCWRSGKHGRGQPASCRHREKCTTTETTDNQLNGFFPIFCARQRLPTHDNPPQACGIDTQGAISHTLRTATGSRLRMFNDHILCVLEDIRFTLDCSTGPAEAGANSIEFEGGDCISPPSLPPPSPTPEAAPPGAPTPSVFPWGTDEACCNAAEAPALFALPEWEDCRAEEVSEDLGCAWYVSLMLRHSRVGQNRLLVADGVGVVPAEKTADASGRSDVSKNAACMLGTRFHPITSFQHFSRSTVRRQKRAEGSIQRKESGMKLEKTRIAPNPQFPTPHMSRSIKVCLWARCVAITEWHHNTRMAGQHNTHAHTPKNMGSVWSGACSPNTTSESTLVDCGPVCAAAMAAAADGGIADAGAPAQENVGILRPLARKQ